MIQTWHQWRVEMTWCTSKSQALWSRNMNYYPTTLKHYQHEIKIIAKLESELYNLNTTHTMQFNRAKLKHMEYDLPVIIILVTIIKQLTGFSSTRNGDSKVDIRNMSQLCSCIIIAQTKGKKNAWILPKCSNQKWKHSLDRMQVKKITEWVLQVIWRLKQKTIFLSGLHFIEQSKIIALLPEKQSTFKTAPPLVTITSWLSPRRVSQCRGRRHLHYPLSNAVSDKCHPKLSSTQAKTENLLHPNEQPIIKLNTTTNLSTKHQFHKKKKKEASIAHLLSSLGSLDLFNSFPKYPIRIAITLTQYEWKQIRHIEKVSRGNNCTIKNAMPPQHSIHVCSKYPKPNWPRNPKTFASYRSQLWGWEFKRNLIETRNSSLGPTKPPLKLKAR